MRRSWGRVRAYAAVASLTIAPALRPVPVAAQASDEVISDPELSSGSSTTAAPAGGDEVIADPELGGGSARTTSEPAPEANYGWGEVYGDKGAPKESEAPNAAASDEDSYDPMANTGIAKIEILGQQSVDLNHEENLEDFYETRLRFGGELDFRISRKLRLSLGTRIDFFYAAPWQNDRDLKRPYKIRNTEGKADDPPVYAYKQTSALDQDRYEVDIVPLSAYVDTTVAEGVHFRLGAQVISLGRMDGFSATDMLAVYDFRPSPKLDPASTKLAQPALRLDWDITSWMTLQAAYVPWFMPHVTRPNRDRYTGSVLTGPGSQNLNLSRGDLLEPSNQTKATESVVRYLGPAPDFSHPQAEARLNMRGGSFEFAVLGGTALEKLPSVYYVPALSEIMLERNAAKRDSSIDNLGALGRNDRSMFDVEYHRYYLVGVDGSFDIAPVQVSFELGFSPERHLYTSSKKGTSLPIPNTTEQICNPDGFDLDESKAPNCAAIRNKNWNGNLMNRSIRKGVGLAMATLHVEWIKSDNFVIAGEAYYMQATAQPHDKSREWTGFTSMGAFLGGLIGGNYLINDGQWRIDLSAIATTGPSLIVSPQLEYRIFEGLYVNLGAQIFEGPAPNLHQNAMRNLAATNVTMGGLLSGYDNAYLGFRYLPN